MPNSNLTGLTATEAAAEIARGMISAEDYTAACLDRIAAIDGEVHAFIHLDRDHAQALDCATSRNANTSQPGSPSLWRPKIRLGSCVRNAFIPCVSGPGLCKSRTATQNGFHVGERVYFKYPTFAPSRSPIPDRMGARVTLPCVWYWIPTPPTR